MAKLIVEALKHLPDDVLRNIRRLNPGKRGVNPTVDGDYIITGRLTLSDVLKILKARKIPYNREAKVVQPKSSRSANQILILEPTKLDEVIETGEAIQPAKTIFASDKESSPDLIDSADDRETEYLRNICSLPSEFATALYQTLDFVAEAINEHKPERHPGIFPCDLVEWEGKKRSGSETEILPTLRPVARYSPVLAKNIWTFIIVSKEVGEGLLLEGAQNQLMESVLNLDEQPELVSQLLSLSPTQNSANTASP